MIESPTTDSRETPEGATADSPSTEAVVVRPHENADDRTRDALVHASDKGTFFHLSAWRRFVQRQYGHEPAELAAWRGEQLVGILPLMRCKSFSGATKLVSIPYAVYGGPAGTDAAVELALLNRAREFADEQRVKYLELRYEDDPGVEMPGTELYSTFRRALTDDPEDVLKAMPKKARAEARKARKRHGLELSEGVWYTDDLYRMFLHNKHTLGSPALPPEHFRRLLDEMGDDVYVHLVRREREPLSAVMSFAFGDTLIAYYSGTAPGADRAFSASNFMYMALQEWASAKGFRVFDFCRSRGGSGAFKFKEHQGFEPTQLHYRYHLVGAKHPPSFNPSNPKTAFLRQTWSKLPLWMVRRMSTKLSGYLT